MSSKLIHRILGRGGARSAPPVLSWARTATAHKAMASETSTVNELIARFIWSKSSLNRPDAETQRGIANCKMIIGSKRQISICILQFEILGPLLVSASLRFHQSDPKIN